MNNVREVNNDILKDWLVFSEDTISSISYVKDKKNLFVLRRFLKGA